MKYLFLKRYNPAYDFYVVNYLKKGGIDMKEIPWERARFRLQLYDKRKESLTQVQQVFSIYARQWVRRRTPKPAFYDVFWHIFGHLPSLAEVREQESKLPREYGKVLFSAGEISQDASEFYGKFICEPLKSEIRNESKNSRISKYLTPQELTKANRAAKSEDDIGKEEHKVGLALLEWCDSITPESLLFDLERVLKEHYEASPHMKLDEYQFKHGGKRIERCEHDSRYLRFTSYRNLEDGQSSAHLSPIRGQAQVREGWLDVDFPWYYILTEE